MAYQTGFWQLSGLRIEGMFTDRGILRIGIKAILIAGILVLLMVLFGCGEQEMKQVDNETILSAISSDE